MHNKYKLLILYGVAVVLGITTGLIGSFFRLAIDHLDTLMSHGLAVISDKGGPALLCSIVMSTVLVFTAWLMVKKIAPEASGSGVQEIEGALAHQRAIFWWRLLPVKFFAGIMAISAKLVLGREGPTIHLGGNLGAMFGDILKFSIDRRDTLIMAGAGAGLATAFNAPLAGILFVMEELRNQFNFNFTNFKTVAIACVMATITLHFIVGPEAVIAMDVFALPSLKSLWLFFVFGLLMGFVGLVFNEALIWILTITDKLSLGQRIIYVLLIGALTGFFAYSEPDLVGGGYKILNQALNLSPSVILLIFVFFIRFFTTMFSYATNTPGGIFAPMLALGAVFGSACFYLLQPVIQDNTLHSGMFAVAGMGALFSASVRSPVTGIVLVVEMTQNYSLILPLMVTCLTSTTVMQLARNEPIYNQLLRRTLRLERMRSNY